MLINYLVIIIYHQSSIDFTIKALDRRAKVFDREHPLITDKYTEIMCHGAFAAVGKPGPNIDHYTPNI